MNILILGSGGREHALAWKVAQSPKVKKIYAAPGNAGIAGLAECVPVKAEDIKGLLAFARAWRKRALAGDVPRTIARILKKSR